MQIEPLTTAEDGCQNFLRLGGSKNKFHMLGRLFQRLQKRVKRRRRKHVHLVDEIDFVTPFGRCISHVLAQLAHVLDAVVACAVDLDHVETVATGDLAAVVAHAAWRNRRAFNAVERLSPKSVRSKSCQHRAGRQTDTHGRADSAPPHFSTCARHASVRPNRRMSAADIFWRKPRNSLG